MRVRFPYPPLLVLSFVLIVVFALGHTLYTKHELEALAARNPGAVGDTSTYLFGMGAITVALAIFVFTVLSYRSRLALEIGERALILHRLHWKSSERRVELPVADLDVVSVRTDPRGIWHVWIETGERRHRLVLGHAVVDVGGAPTRPGNPGDADEARAHPVVKALAETVGDKLRVTA